MQLGTEQLLREILESTDEKIEALEIGRSSLDVDTSPDSEEYDAVGRVQDKMNELAALIESELRSKPEPGAADTPSPLDARLDRWFKDRRS
jgi:hypothetical protein